MVRNVSVTPEQFKQELQNMAKKRKLKTENIIVKASNLINCENIFGDDVINAKNGFAVFEGKDGADFKYIYGFSDIRDCYDTDRQAYDCSGLCECYGVETDHSSIGLYLSAGMDRSFYNVYCFSNQDTFGCIGLRNKQYCILNKQYTKEQYEVLVPKIIEHMKKTNEWGEFFPSSISPFGYNETVAQEYFPITKEKV